MLYLFLISVLVQGLFAWLYRYRQAAAPVCLTDDVLPGVSILICGKNEAEHFSRFLPEVFMQDYPLDRFEVLVVNDGSTDTTESLLNALQATYPQLRVLHLAPDTVKTFPGKKHALWQGLKQCRYPVVLLTDADCTPATDQWLRYMASAYQQAKQQSPGQSYFVLGYGAYEQNDTLLNRFIRWETVHTFQQYASWALSGAPYMGVGRNLLYERAPVLQLLEDDEAFAALFRQTVSGDDDMIISCLAKSGNTLVLGHPAAKTISTVKDSWNAWWRQKTRHVSSGKYYPEKVKRGLAAYAFSGFLFWISGLALLFGSNSLQIQIIVLILMLLRTGLYYRQALRWYKVLGEKGLGWFYGVGDLMWVVYNIILAPFIFFKNKQKWK